VPRLSKASTADLEAPEPSGLGFPSAQSEGAQAVVQTVATEVSQARQVALQVGATQAARGWRGVPPPLAVPAATHPQALHMNELHGSLALQRDAEGAVNILRLLDTPTMREYRALRVALHDAKAGPLWCHAPAASSPVPLALAP
jgi:hypothetical protein